MEYCFVAEKICKQYKHLKALNGCSMHIPKGAIYGFVGKNGAGKTTMIRLMTGLQRPDSGSYTLYGVPYTDSGMSKMRRRMGAVIENPSLYMDMTAVEPENAVSDAWAAILSGNPGIAGTGRTGRYR